MIAGNVSPDDISRMVMLAFGEMNHGGPYWAYVAVKPSRYDEFMRLMESGTYDMQRFAGDGFGEPIVSGEGATPPLDVSEKLAKMFDIPIKELFASTDAKKAIETKIQKLT